MLPDSTRCQKLLAKAEFLKHLNLTTRQKQAFQKQVKTLFWRNKIAPATCNLAKGEKIEEIQLFHLKLHAPLDEKLLYGIEKAIPYKIIFLLEFEEKFQLWISPSVGSKTSRYLRTGWREWDALPIHITGMNMDEAFENLVHQIARLEDPDWDSDISIEKNLLIQEHRKRLCKEIDALTRKIHAERQLNRQCEMSRQLKSLKNELEELNLSKNSIDKTL